MLSSKQMQSFDRNGFVKGSRVLSEEQAELLCEDVLRVIDDHEKQIERERRPVHVANISGNAQAPVWQIVNIWQGSPLFEEMLVRNPVLAEEAAQIMQVECNAREIRLFHDQIQYKPAAVGGVNMWHQDSPYWPILEPKDVQLTAWVALDDAGEDNGCMSMVPGSHRWGDQIPFLHEQAKASLNHDFNAMPPHFTHNGQEHEVKIVPCPVEQGHVHFHHALTWHGSPANTSGRPRRAIALHFMSDRAVFHEKGGHPMKPFVKSAPDAKVEGAAFPLVWQASST